MSEQYLGEEIAKLNDRKNKEERNKRLTALALAAATVGGLGVYSNTRENNNNNGAAFIEKIDKPKTEWPIPVRQETEDQKENQPIDTIGRDFIKSLAGLLPERQHNQKEKFRIISMAVRNKINRATFRGESEEYERKYFNKLYYDLNYRRSIADKIKKIAEHFKIPVDILATTAALESRFDIRAESGKGAVGLMQLTPDTITEAENLLNKNIDPMNETDSLEAGAIILKKYYKMFGDWGLARVAYAVGPSHLSRFLKKVCPEFKLIKNNELDARSRKILKEKISTGEITLPDLYDMSPDMFQHAFFLSVITKPTLFYLLDQKAHQKPAPAPISDKSRYAKAGLSRPVKIIKPPANLPSNNLSTTRGHR